MSIGGCLASKLTAYAGHVKVPDAIGPKIMTGIKPRPMLGLGMSVVMMMAVKLQCGAENSRQLPPITAYYVAHAVLQLIHRLMLERFDVLPVF